MQYVVWAGLIVALIVLWRALGNSRGLSTAVIALARSMDVSGLHVRSPLALPAESRLRNRREPASFD